MVYQKNVLFYNKKKESVELFNQIIFKKINVIMKIERNKKRCIFIFTLFIKYSYIQ